MQRGICKFCHVPGIFVTVRNVKNISRVTINLPAGYNNTCIH